MEQVVTLLDEFQGRFENGDLQGASQLFALPAVVYEGDEIRRLDNQENFESFLLENRTSISELESIRLKRSFVQVDDQNEDSIVVNVIWIACDQQGNPIFLSPEVLYCNKVGEGWRISIIEHNGWVRVH